jgi:hypothetical protein
LAVTGPGPVVVITIATRSRISDAMKRYPVEEVEGGV